MSTITKIISKIEWWAKVKIKMVRVFSVILLYSVLLLTSNTHAEDTENNRISLPAFNREFAICGITVASDNSLLVTSNVRDRGVWGSSLFVNSQNDQWSEEKLSPSGIAGVGLGVWQGRVYVMFQQYANTLCAIWNGTDKIQTLEIGNIDSEPIISIFIKDRYIYVGYKRLEYYKKYFFSFEKQPRQKVFVSIFDAKSNELKDIRLTPKGINYDSWNPLIINNENSTTIYCLERAKISNEFGSCLIKYVLDPTNNARRIPMLENVQAFDVLDTGNSLCIATEFNSNKIKLIISNTDSSSVSLEIGKGVNPKLVLDENGNVHILWRSQNEHGYSLKQRIISNGVVSKEQTLIDNIGRSLFYDRTGLRQMGEAFAACSVPGGDLYVIWENEGRIYGKNIN